MNQAALLPLLVLLILGIPEDPADLWPLVSQSFQLHLDFLQGQLVLASLYYPLDQANPVFHWFPVVQRDLQLPAVLESQPAQCHQ